MSSVPDSTPVDSPGPATDDEDAPGSAGALDGSVAPAGSAGLDDTDEPGPADGETELLDLQIASELAELASQRDEYRDLAQRVQADFENYRKRVATQIRDEADRASGRLAEAMLPVLDATEAAFLRHPDEVGPLLNLMLGELRKQGLETLNLQDQPFDPNLAEAVAHEQSDGGEVVVAEVLRSGYRWNGRTLRPAMVRTRD